jgi:hypothetical protein
MMLKPLESWNPDLTMLTRLGNLSRNAPEVLAKVIQDGVLSTLEFIYDTMGNALWLAIWDAAVWSVTPGSDLSHLIIENDRCFNFWIY